MYERNQVRVDAAPAVAVLAWDTPIPSLRSGVLPFRPELQDMFEADSEWRTADGTFNATLQAGYFIPVGSRPRPCCGADERVRR